MGSIFNFFFESKSSIDLCQVSQESIVEGAKCIINKTLMPRDVCRGINVYKQRCSCVKILMADDDGFNIYAL